MTDVASPAAQTNDQPVVAGSLPYDAILIVSFGGPEQPEDVIPFLENVLRGKPVPRERMLEVAEHYYHFGGKSPINDQTRDLISALQPALTAAGVALPVYWGNRNWHPLLPDTLQQMQADGIRRAIAFFVSAYSSYSGCRQYRENIIAARDTVGPAAPQVDKLRVYYNHPDFIAANTECLQAAIAALPEAERGRCQVAFCAHSIPTTMANTCHYVRQLEETARLVASAAGIPEDRFRLVWQSRSGRPQDPWLEPDICDHLRSLQAAGATSVVLSPIGFLSDHMEVLYDLDTEAKTVCGEIGVTMSRAATVGTHPRFIAMIVDLLRERLGLTEGRQAIGRFGPNHDVCPVDCCLPMQRPRPST